MRGDAGKYVLVFGVAAAIVVLDQLTKLWVMSALRLGEAIPVVDGFVTLTYVRNTGAAFSLLADRSAAFRVPFFAVVAAVALAAIVAFVRQTPSSQRVVLFACASVLGGAVGNLVDRLRQGEVVDFVLVHWRDWYWPAFNVADSFITVGVVTLLAHALIAGDGTPQRAAPANGTHGEG